MLALALLAIVGFLPSLIGRLRRGPMMDVENVKQKLDTGEDVLLLDVRSAEDYVGEQGHVKGSLLIPLEELTTRLSEIESFQEKMVMTICRTDRRSEKAAQLLTQKGFADVHVVKMGMTDWNAKNFPVEKD